MKTGKTLILGGLLALLAGAAAAEGMHGGPRGHEGSRGGPGGAAFLERFDADGDGAVTLDEARAAQAARLAQHDADGDGTLSLAEFEALFAELGRPRMVDAFQHLDADGDGQVTGDEMAAQVDRMATRLDRDGDGDIDRDDRQAMRGHVQRHRDDG